MILCKFLKPLLLATLLLSPVQQTFALNQSRIYKFAGGVFTAALSVNLVRYCNSKIDSLENLLEELDDDSDETREERVAQEKKIKRCKFAKYLSLAAAIAGGVYAGKQAWEIWQELSGNGGTTTTMYSRDTSHGQKFVPGYACSYEIIELLHDGMVDRAPIRYTVYPIVDGKAPAKENREIIIDREIALPNDINLTFRSFLERVREQINNTEDFTPEDIRASAVAVEQELGIQCLRDQTVRFEEVEE